MEPINKRIRELRKALQFTQEKFGKILGISKSGICDIEAGRRRVTEAHILLLTNWNNKNISERWLRTGVGSMFQKPELSFSDVSGSCDEFIQALVTAYLELDLQERSTVRQFLRKIIAGAEQPENGNK